MPGKSKSAIRMAIQSCLVRCRQSGVPLTSLSEFIEQLTRIGWDSETTKEIRQGVLTALYRANPATR